MKHVKLVWKYGEEAICPECGNHNACLFSGQIGKAIVYECRDCHKLFMTGGTEHRDTGRDDLLGRKIIEQDALLIEKRRA